MPVAIVIVVLGLLFLVLAVARATAKVVHAEYAEFLRHVCPPPPAHTCPPPEIQYVTVERNHNPWTPTPWKEHSG